MWVRQIILALIGISAGTIIAGGLFGFIVSLGVISDFADRTHTGDKIILYENAIMLGGTLGNIFYIYQPTLNFTGASIVLSIFGLFSGIFTGCWAMALAEILNVFPIFVRRLKLVKCIPYIILGIAIGKGLGSLIYFGMG